MTAVPSEALKPSQCPEPVEVTSAKVIPLAPADSSRTATRRAFVVVAVWTVGFRGIGFLR